MDMAPMHMYNYEWKQKQRRSFICINVFFAFNDGYLRTEFCFSWEQQAIPKIGCHLLYRKSQKLIYFVKLAENIPGVYIPLKKNKQKCLTRQSGNFAK